MIRSNATRLSFIVLAALLVNALMFTAIRYMVINRQMRLADTSQFDLANFIRVQEQSRDVRSRRDPKAPEKPKAEQQQDLSRLAEASKGGIGGLNVDMPDIDIDIDVGGGISLARELTPLVRFSPEYPMKARQDRIEGYVLLRFVVTETGSVADPEVLRAVPPGIFDRAAIRSVLRWKYQPQLVDGEPVSVMTYTRIVFRMSE
ncbi:MAG: energy transducer TonB [Gammaproteobacteria bacterium]|nr:energy transducer TonB [Gammaproteobacteria bacterium]